MRSERRHHHERLKASRRFYGGRDLRHEPVGLGRAVNTPTPCSCWLCSPKKQGEASIQERRALEAWRKIEQAN